MTIDQHKLDALAGRLLGDLSAGYGGVMVSLGDKLGLYRAMAGSGPLSSHEIARRSGCSERYVREWLNSQVAGGYIDYHPASATYELTPEQAAVLADDTSPVFLPHAWQVVASMWADEAKTLNAFKTGEGVSWGEHSEGLYCGVAAFYRNCYTASLVSEWLPTLTGLTAKLEKGAKVADVGCGHGHSTVLMAQAYPESRFWGFDAHEGSIEIARGVAREAGVAERVSFEVASADEYARHTYDLICFFDCLHDMGRPVDAMRYARTAMAEDGTIMLIEPYAGDRVEDNINPVGRLYYAASTTMCCAHAISEHGTHVLGAQAGPRRLDAVLKSAGFGTVRQAAQTPFNLIIEARL
ncbi:class I SAM-dependent methyltransferase [Microvirga tunisiensis]|jgi:2-polyprenyl-3-methyl-5-hydroxy-6-metoxy-1,4-benzoquinol methylase|uniref:Class I SAM-dependent methyltransferase n=1 Tax=Microvirga tunisiensis TaxID=2108360 RepID=A0A5N7MRA6_9HYPH|nr:class I SAM-dependent methyltransferase [Microvirga tunisiensis]MPR11463.1 class I SAM-dependent methyltransferase [Microvirga tunisiensis]MPR29483.1 class I SAM-dependent methyltransferase [Microvirga tunisiensis]